jgi:hypothetical protein
MYGLSILERRVMCSAKCCATGVALSLVLVLAGCGGGGAEVRTTTTTVSIGQQLIDLKNAHDKGSMSDSEYRKLREEIIDNTK